MCFHNTEAALIVAVELLDSAGFYIQNVADMIGWKFFGDHSQEGNILVKRKLTSVCFCTAFPIRLKRLL